MVKIVETKRIQVRGKATDKYGIYEIMINGVGATVQEDGSFIFKTRTYKTAPKSITRKYELPSRKAITSSTLKTVPNKSVFLKYLIDRLNNNTERYLTARRIFDKIEEPVMNNSKNVPQYGTIQEVWR